MKTIFVILTSLLSMSSSTQALPGDGQAVVYQIRAAARCNCNASLIVSGNNGQTGFILNSQRVSAITVIVQGKEYVLSDPPEGIRAYYADLKFNAWVKAELAKQGLEVSNNDSVYLNTFTGSVLLFADQQASTPIPN